MRGRWCLARNGGSRKRGRRSGAALAWAAILGIVPAAAREPAAPPCIPDGGESVRVAAVAPDLTLRLADGRTVLLAGIDPVRATLVHPGFDAEARDRVQAWLGGHDAVMRSLATSPDRWNRWPALVFAPPRDEGAPTLSVALALVDAGLARTKPDPATHGCRTALLEAEDAARRAGLGLWADPYYAVRQASEAGGWSDGLGTLVLVQGRVTRVGNGRSWTEVDLGGPEARVSVRLGKREMAELSDRGLGREALPGRWLRVRGLLDDRFGLGLDAVDADGIESLDADGETSRNDAR